MPKIIVTGPKSSGKSSIGWRLAQLRGLSFYDLDERIEKIFEEEEGVHSSFREIFKRHGEDKFRELELRAINSIIGLDKILLSTGGSTFINEEAKNLLLQDSYIILLCNAPETLWQRTIRKGMPSYLEGTIDPHGTFCKRVESILNTIKPVAEIVMETKDLSVEDVAQMLDYELDFRKVKT
jgi:shikimate kinase